MQGKIKNKLSLFFSLVFLTLIFFMVYVSFKGKFLYKKKASEMPLGQAIMLNGQSSNPEYVSIPSNHLVPYPNFTVEAWIKPSIVDPPLNQTFTSYILTKKAIDGTQTQPYVDDYGLKFQYTNQSNGVLSVHYWFTTYSGETTDNCMPLSLGASTYRSLADLNKWTHVAGVIDHGFMSIYVDGKRLHTSITPDTRFKGNVCAKNNPLQIGAGPGNYFQGAIDEVRLSDVARYVDDFTPTFSAFTTDMHTAAIWHFDGDLSDRNGLGSHPGTAIGSIDYIEGVVQTVDPTLTITPTPVIRSRVFVTSTTYAGNLGGLKGADAKCQERANAEQLGGKWKAWMSDDYISVNDRLHHSEIPYKLLNYTVIADNWDDLVTNFDQFTNPLNSPINVYENRQTRPSGDGTPYVWTNTYKDANDAGLSCNNWTNGNSDIGNSGSVASIGEAWTYTANGGSYCSNKFRLYCFEQPDVPTPTPENLRIFVTSNTYTGNLGGLAGADAKCQASADAASLVGVWKAWLSSSTETANMRLVHSEAPYKLINDFTPVANNWADLTDQTLINRIDLTETGQSIKSVPDNWNVWTNTSTSGSLYESQAKLICNNWTSDSATSTGRGGASNAVNSTWTASYSGSHPCNSVGRLYCIEQMRGVTPTPTPTPTDIPPPTPVLDKQQITLQTGWNWVSFRVEPIDGTVATVLGSALAKIDRILSETEIYSTAIDPAFNTLKKLKAGKLYLIYANEAASFEVSGQEQAATAPLPLHQGWNWIGYYPEASMPITTALASIESKYQLLHGESGSYKPGAEGNTLEILSPNQGYMIYLNEAATLVYPETSSSARNTLVNQAECKISKTSKFTHLVLTPANKITRTATSNQNLIVEAVNSEGQVFGCANYLPGRVAGLRIYGGESLSKKELDGFKDNETIYIQTKDKLTGTISNKQRMDFLFQPDLQYHSASYGTGLTISPIITRLPTIKITPRITLPAVTKSLCRPGQTKPYYKKVWYGCVPVNNCGVSSCSPVRPR